jgi:hypothetical protein
LDDLEEAMAVTDDIPRRHRQGVSEWSGDLPAGKIQSFRETCLGNPNRGIITSSDVFSHVAFAS